MRYRFLQVLFGCVLVAIAACTPTSTPATSGTPAPSAPPVVPPRLSTPVPSPSPMVEPERLFQHIQALNFERYQSRDRTRARDYLTQILKAYGWQPQSQSFAGGVNLVANRPGTDAKAGTLLVTAHYDTVRDSPGADDNASAIATALEIARLLGPQKTVRSLQIAFFDQEEQGLLGSFAFTSESANLVNLSGVINLEMLGYACHAEGCQSYPEGLPEKPSTNRGDFLAIIGDQEHLPLLNAFQIDSFPTNNPSSLPPVLTLPVPLKGLLTPDLLRSDHAPFWYANIGAVMVTDTANFRNPHYHQPSDTPDTLDRPFLTGSAQRVVNTINHLLNSQESLATPIAP
ncbi:M28 family peptidase [Leptothermofonsia sp. ETS-13]|uniref:M28 family peptidase n=1 Tax=Leptothermofonsia sp. ETS-13 TaxID=3035696 RepID=UPI003BA21948